MAKKRSDTLKNKGDIMNCGNYRGIKLMCHSMKLYERVHENRLRNIVSIREEQFGFLQGKSTTDAILALRHVSDSCNKDTEKDSKTYCVFIDLEKAYYTVPREELYWCMRDKGCGRSTPAWRRTCTIKAKL